MATAMTASGWYPSDVTVLRSWRPWGPEGQRQNLVQLQLEATNFGGGADTYPTDGIPAPDPSVVGFRENISYIIPVSPFFAKAGPGAGPSLNGGAMVWGCFPPTFGASGAGTNNACKLRFAAIRLATTVSGGPGAEATDIRQREFVTLYTASTMFSTDALVAYGIFVGK